jgi:molybdate transport system ATP-binding protein
MADQLTVRAAVVVELGDFTLDVEVEAAPGTTLALTGPNGAGKTSLLRCLSGVQPITSGRIQVGPRVLDEPRSRTWVPPEGRRVGVVFQDHRLFPSMTALENVAFGLRAQGRTRRAARETASDWIDTVGLMASLDMGATDLSGGQAQRVALARCLATEPDLVLLDEPFASVDDASRAAMLDVLASLESTTIIATHDQDVVDSLADEVIGLADGRIS